jgi:hypothetical protein
VVAQLLGEWPVGAPDEQSDPPAVPAIAVDGDHRVDVVEK